MYPDKSFFFAKMTPNVDELLIDNEVYVFIKALETLSYTCKEHEVTGQLVISELLKKYAHPLLLIY